MNRARLIRAGTAVLRVLPFSIARGIAAGVAEVCALLLTARRQTIEDNIRRLSPDSSPADRRRLARATFRNLARCTLDFLRVPLLGPAGVRALVDVTGGAHMADAVARGRGVILVSAHTGNWEIIGTFSADFPTTWHGMAERRSQDVDAYQVYERYRRAAGPTVEIIPVDERSISGTRQAIRALGLGEVVMALADRVIFGRGVVVDFCGGRRELPTGPASLARLTGAAVVCYALTWDARTNRYRCEFYPPLDPAAFTDDQHGTQAVADQLSAIVRAHPDQWFVFQPNWLDV